MAALYESIFGDFPDYPTWRQAVWAKHSVRQGFRLTRAFDGEVLAVVDVFGPAENPRSQEGLSID